MRTTDFDNAIKTIVTRIHENHGIGTLGEKSVHAVVKLYMEPDEDYHETPIDGYVADIYRDEKVIEIQTGNFQALRDKLRCFLPNYDVTIVHPIPAKKNIIWVDPDTGEIIEKSASYQKRTPQRIFRELYKIRDSLKDPNLHIVILMIDMEETRLLDGYGKDKKKHATKYDRIPLNLVEEIHIDELRDYLALIPPELEQFTSAEYAKAVHIPKSQASAAMQILYDMGVVERVGKKGKAYIYEVIE